VSSSPIANQYPTTVFYNSMGPIALPRTAQRGTEAMASHYKCHTYIGIVLIIIIDNEKKLQYKEKADIIHSFECTMSAILKKLINAGRKYAPSHCVGCFSCWG